MLENYEVVITTSNAYRKDGFDGQVFLQLIGRDGDTTKRINLNEHLEHNFQPGEQAVFKLKLSDIGIPEFVRFKLRGSSPVNQWACDDVVVTYKDTSLRFHVYNWCKTETNDLRKRVTYNVTKVRFPVYDWIETETTVAAGKAYTYTQADQELKDVRSKEIASTKERFQWIPKAKSNQEIGFGIPRYVDAKTYFGLPKDFQWKEKRVDSFLEAAFHAVIGTLHGFIVAKIEEFWTNFTLDDFKLFYTSIENVQNPPFIDRWNTDKEFGRQQIMGVTPLALKRFTDWPVGCGITDEFVSDVLGGKSLEEEMNEGKIFIGDYSTVFEGVTRNKNYDGKILYCPDAVGLFHADQEGDLVPIAIQLEMGNSATIFTPNDSKEDWMLAKMYYRVAASNLHEWYYHFQLTHDVIEPFAVALFRNIPRSHPLYKLLRPHLQTVSAINTDARAALIGPGTIANKSLAILGIDLARSTYKTFNMSGLRLPKVLKERGLDDQNAMPKNYFRDDSLKLWSRINKFVGSILKLYYSCDKDVADDAEIQAFTKDVANEGLGWQDGNTRGMETDITSLEQLIELCTTLIYTSSAGHAAVNFPQFQNYQFIPNSPVGMRLPPHKRGEATMKRILNSLPDKFMAMEQIAITYLLSERSTDAIYLGNYPMKLFTDDDAQAVIKAFQADLEELEQEIEKRNKTAGVDAYSFLLPSLVPNSIAV